MNNEKYIAGKIYYFQTKDLFLLCVGFDQNNFKFMNCLGYIYEWEIELLPGIKPLFPLDS
jgi:hypothetical protein